ncbi:MAG: hypothetical protein WCR92_09265 [Candidatus Cloacimonadaceae bacterium]
MELVKKAPARKSKEAMNIKIDPVVKRRLKIHCYEKGITIQDFITALIEGALMKPGA